MVVSKIGAMPERDEGKTGEGENGRRGAREKPI
jgi:hypothetical protein